MDANDESGPSLDEVLERLRKEADERRGAGGYAEGLEAPLDDHLGPTMSSRQAADGVESLRQGVAQLHQRVHVDPSPAPTDSRVPGGQVVHRAAARVVARHTQVIAEQVRELAAETTALLESLVAIVEDHTLHAHPHLLGQIDRVLDRVTSFERASFGPEADLADLRHRIERLEAAEARRQFRPWFSSKRFEGHFRGSRPDLLARYRDLAQQLQGCGPVLDIGFGRGEFLELLGELGVEARGIEVDPALVDDAATLGLDVSAGDALDTLATSPDGGLGAIVLIQVVEHLAAQELLDLVLLSADKLRPGGRLLMETVNPRSLYIFANSFYLDPTHLRPIHPGYLEFLCWEAGFAAVETQWRSEVPQSDRLSKIETLPDLDADIERLNDLLFGPGDYAVIATR